MITRSVDCSLMRALMIGTAELFPIFHLPREEGHSILPSSFYNTQWALLFTECTFRADVGTQSTGVTDLIEDQEIFPYKCQGVERTSIHTCAATVAKILVHHWFGFCDDVFPHNGWFDKDMPVWFFRIAIDIGCVCCHSGKVTDTRVFPVPPLPLRTAMVALVPMMKSRMYLIQG